MSALLRTLCLGLLALLVLDPAPGAARPSKRPRPPVDDSEACTPGYDPCIPPGPDVDCAGGSGDGPRYVEGPIRVTGTDPYGLDRDRDGIGCE